MPMVGNKEYPYTPSGIAAAKAAARKKGLPMVMKKKRSRKKGVK